MSVFLKKSFQTLFILSTFLLASYNQKTLRLSKASKIQGLYYNGTERPEATSFSMQILGESIVIVLAGTEPIDLSGALYLDSLGYGADQRKEEVPGILKIYNEESKLSRTIIDVGQYYAGKKKDSKNLIRSKETYKNDLWTLLIEEVELTHPEKIGQSTILMDLKLDKKNSILFLSHRFFSQEIQEIQEIQINLMEKQ